MSQNNPPKRIVAVASGKGGVGKSTCTVNLALALQAGGLAVGVLDADIYGPSVPLMLGVKDGVKPKLQDNKHFMPVPAAGLQTMSIGYILESDQAAAWRGPMASNALAQMLGQTRWRNLDYLLIDMPPGTGDIALTLAQKVPLHGALIITTPQRAATGDAAKAMAMFGKVAVPIIGLVENMGIYKCPLCDHEEPLFGTGHTDDLAKDHDTRVIARLPLTPELAAQMDAGKSPLVADPEGDEAAPWRALAESFTKAADRIKSQAPKIQT